MRMKEGKLYEFLEIFFFFSFFPSFSWKNELTMYTYYVCRYNTLWYIIIWKPMINSNTETNSYLLPHRINKIQISHPTLMRSVDYKFHHALLV